MVSETRRFVIRRTFLVPLGLVLLLLGALLAVGLLQGQPTAKMIFLVIFILPVAVLFGASVVRRLEIDPTGVTAVRLGRTRRIDYTRVTALEAVQVRSRVFLTLVAGEDDFLIISNSYADFPGLVNSLVAALPAAVITEEARHLATAPPQRHADVVMAWFAVLAMLYVLSAQFGS
jgi:uncharacterized membrane protein